MPPTSYVNFTASFLWFVFILGMIIVTISFYIDTSRKNSEDESKEEKCKKDKE